jgi:DNA-binding NtrC family response regulator
MAEEKKRVLLIGERPDMELFARLGEEGYEVAALESPYRARTLYPLYRPHVIIVYLRYPKDVTILEECLALAGRVPVVAALSLIAKQNLVSAVKEKAAAFVVLPAKPQTLRETLRSVALSEDEEQSPSARKTILRTDYPGEKKPTQEILLRSRL